VVVKSTSRPSKIEEIFFAIFHTALHSFLFVPFHSDFGGREPPYVFFVHFALLSKAPQRENHQFGAINLE